MIYHNQKLIYNIYKEFALLIAYLLFVLVCIHFKK